MRRLGGRTAGPVQNPAQALEGVGRGIVDTERLRAGPEGLAVSVEEPRGAVGEDQQ